jgi:hypothetical protein
MFVKDSFFVADRHAPTVKIDQFSAVVLVPFEAKGVPHDVPNLKEMRESRSYFTPRVSARKAKAPRKFDKIPPRCQTQT